MLHLGSSVHRRCSCLSRTASALNWVRIRGSSRKSRLRRERARRVLPILRLPARMAEECLLQGKKHLPLGRRKRGHGANRRRIRTRPKRGIIICVPLPMTDRRRSDTSETQKAKDRTLANQIRRRSGASHQRSSGTRLNPNLRHHRMLACSFPRPSIQATSCGTRYNPSSSVLKVCVVARGRVVGGTGVQIQLEEREGGQNLVAPPDSSGDRRIEHTALAL